MSNPPTLHPDQEELTILLDADTMKRVKWHALLQRTTVVQLALTGILEWLNTLDFHLGRKPQHIGTILARLGYLEGGEKRHE
jgi:hypothetical protein